MYLRKLLLVAFFAIETKMRRRDDFYNFCYWQTVDKCLILKHNMNMKSKSLLILLCFYTVFAFAQEHFIVMSYNIRYDNAGDGINKWSNRKENLIKLIIAHHPAIIGTQEVLVNQLNDLNSGLINYESIGVGRDDGKQKGEYAAIFFDKTIFTKLDGGNFWLSETPEIAGSKSWDAALTRIATWVKLKHSKSGKIIYVFNTHFDHVGKVAREKSALLIKEKIKLIAGNNNYILIGDLNTEPSEEAYQYLMNTGDQLFNDAAGTDNKEATFCGFETANKNCKRIDYILYSKKLKTKNYLVIHENDGKYYPSDHLPIISEIAF